MDQSDKPLEITDRQEVTVRRERHRSYLRHFGGPVTGLPGTNAPETEAVRLHAGDEPTAIGAELDPGRATGALPHELAAGGVPDLDALALPGAGRDPSPVGAQGDIPNARVRQENPLGRPLGVDDDGLT